jgi:hypothetical protein
LKSLQVQVQPVQPDVLKNLCQALSKTGHQMVWQEPNLNNLTLIWNIKPNWIDFLGAK